MIDIKNYIEQKEKELASIAKIGNDFAISIRRFNPETGEEVDPLVEGFKLKQVEDLKIGLQKAIANIEVFIEDINAL